MIKDKDERSLEKTVIDLTGPLGNAFNLLAMAHYLAEKLNLDSDEIRNEMKETNYENLICVFDSYFGEYVDLQR